jgi:hypothetical protein
VKRRARRSTCSRDFPLSCCVIIDADACEMAQPCPVNFTSCTVSPANSICSVISSPHSGFFLSTDTFAHGNSPRFRGRR